MLDQEGRFLAVAQKLQLDSWPFILGFLMAYQNNKTNVLEYCFFRVPVEFTKGMPLLLTIK